MRVSILSCLLAAGTAVADPTTEAARTSLGASLSTVRDQHAAWLFNLEVVQPLHERLWLTASAGIGIIDLGSRGQYKSTRAYEGRVGAMSLACDEGTCLGLAASVGYHHQKFVHVVEFEDFESFDSSRGLAFAELRVVGRVRSTSTVKLETSVGFRVQSTTAADGEDDELDAALFVSVGGLIMP